MHKDQILALFGEIRGFLTDSRPSQEITPPGSPFSVRMLTPESMEATRNSPGKKLYMDKVLDLLKLSPTSAGLKSYLTSIVDGLYDGSEPADRVMALFGNPEEDRLDLFDPEKVQEYELRELNGAAWWWLLEIVGFFLGPLSQEQEREITTAQAALTVGHIFGGPDNWISTEQVEKPIYWNMYMGHMQELVQWVERFQEHYAREELPEGFDDVVRVATKLLEYK